VRGAVSFIYVLTPRLLTSYVIFKIFMQIETGKCDKSVLCEENFVSEEYGVQNWKLVHRTKHNVTALSHSEQWRILRNVHNCIGGLSNNLTPRIGCPVSMLQVLFYLISEMARFYGNRRFITVFTGARQVLNNNSIRSKVLLKNWHWIKW